MTGVPNPAAALAAAADELGQSFAALAVRMRVWAAMAAAFNGDPDRARETLDGLPDDTLQAVSDAGKALTALADELRAEAGQ